jgi:G3E family GTPase
MITPAGSPEAVPVTVLTGFLGAGKTTLLNRILSSDHGLRVGVLVNDFGAINIDEQLVVGMDAETISLANGCVCCEIDGELIDAIDRLVRRPESPQYIVLEASGVADPMGIAMTIGNARVQNAIRLDGIISIVDVDQVLAHGGRSELAELKLRQIGYSDMVLLNKIDLVDVAAIERVHTWIDERIPRVRTIETTYADVPFEVLLGVGELDGRKTVADEGHAHGAALFESWSYVSDQPLSIERLQSAVKRFPASIFRCKGIVASVEEPRHRVVVQCVGRRTTIAPGDGWGGQRPRTELVVIGAAGDLDTADLRERLDACRATPSSI